jgi:hypothetical protein
MVADVLKQYRASAFEYEGACTHAIRAQLCLNGWAWQDAQDEAHDLVQRALHLIGARRPPTYLANGHYVHDHLDLTTRVRCARCFRPLPEERRKYCSDVCHASARADRMTMDQRERNRAMKQAQRAAWRKQRVQP